MRKIHFITIIAAITLFFSACEIEDYSTGTRLKVLVYSDFNQENPVSDVRVDLYENLHDQNDPDDTSLRIDSKTTGSSGYVVFTGLEQYVGGRLYLRLEHENDSEGNITVYDIVKDEMNEKVIGGFAD